MKVDLEFSVPVNDLVHQLYWQEDAAVIDLIKRVDERMADCSFTLELLNYFANALRHEGYGIVLEIKEP